MVELKADIENAVEEARAAKPRGFARLSPEQRREFARRGGIEAHRLGTAHVFTVEEAKIAGSKGGKATKRKKEIGK